VADRIARATIQGNIAAASQIAKWEKDLFVQKKRLADAERSPKTKETKKAREGVRISSNKPSLPLD
jgi:hypothetical protein